jgi:CheY-like chemotaxis protein
MSELNHRVLVADDDESIRKSLCKLLHGEGYQVVSVANGAEAMETFRRGPDRIDLLLLDLNMPLKNGWATLDRLRETNPTLPVLVVTGQSNQCEMAEAAGVNALVEKPIDVPVLLQLIDQLLAGPDKPGSHPAYPREFPFQFVGGASYASRHPWTRLNVVPHPHGGLNE